MRATIPVVAAVLIATGLLVAGTLVTLLTETLPDPGPLAAASVLAVVLLAAGALGARGKRLSTSYW